MSKKKEIKNKLKITIIPIIMLIIILIIIVLTIIKTFSLNSEITYESKIYKIEENYISNISPYTSISLYKKYFDLKNCLIEVVDINNNKLESGYIYTGSKTLIYDESNTIIKTYTNIITGDINSDGKINSNDITELANYLIKREDQEEYQIKSMDINENGEIKVSDLVLLKDTLTNGYQKLTLNKDDVLLMTNETERLIPTITPNKILNQNLTWTSSNPEIATVDESGLITPLQEGETNITAITSDGAITATSKVTIDNTIRLSETAKTAYVGGSEASVQIKAVDYENLTCNSSDEEIATCEIKEQKLIIKPIGIGTTTITVTSPTYGEATLQLSTIDTYFQIFPKYYCLPTNVTGGPGTISTFDSGTIELFDISDRKIITDAYVANNGFYIKTGSTTGTAQVTFIENNGNKTQTITLDVYKLQIPSIGGVGFTGGQEFSSEIIAENTGKLSCRSEDETIATCRIEDNRIVVTPLKEGVIYMYVTGSKCPDLQVVKYLAVIQSGGTE